MHPLVATDIARQGLFSSCLQLHNAWLTRFPFPLAHWPMNIQSGIRMPTGQTVWSSVDNGANLRHKSGCLYRHLESQSHRTSTQNKKNTFFSK